MRSQLSAEDVEQRLQKLNGWTLDERKWIVRKYRFAAFMAAVGFVNEIARIAEDSNHHPLIAIDYKLVTLRLTTWSAGGLTELDFSTAEKFELAYESFRP